MDNFHQSIKVYSELQFVLYFSRRLKGAGSVAIWSSHKLLPTGKQKLSYELDGTHLQYIPPSSSKKTFHVATFQLKEMGRRDGVCYPLESVENKD